MYSAIRYWSKFTLLLEIIWRSKFSLTNKTRLTIYYLQLNNIYCFIIFKCKCHYQFFKYKLAVFRNKLTPQREWECDFPITVAPLQYNGRSLYSLCLFLTHNVNLEKTRTIASRSFWWLFILREFNCFIIVLTNSN